MKDRQICIGGKWSGDDLGVEITAGGFGDPPPRTLRETIAGMDGSYDFSKLDGKLHYGDRTGAYTFCIRGSDASEAQDIKAALLEWLVSGNELYDENIAGYIYTDVSCTGTDEPRIVGDERRTMLITAHFTAAPYMRSRSGQIIDCLIFTPNAESCRYLFTSYRAASQSARAMYYLSRMVGYGTEGFPSSYVSYDEVSHSGSVIAATPRVTFPAANTAPMYYMMPKVIGGTAVGPDNVTGGSVIKETEDHAYFLQQNGEALSIGISGYDATALADPDARDPVTAAISHAGWLTVDDMQSFDTSLIPGTSGMRILSEGDPMLTINGVHANISGFPLELKDLLTVSGAKDELCKLQYCTVKERR